MIYRVGYIRKNWRIMFTRFGFILLYVLFYLEFATASWQYALLPFHVFMGSMHGL